MESSIDKSPNQISSDLQVTLNELIRCTYLSGLVDGKEYWNETEEVLNTIINSRVSKLISVLNLN